MLQHELLMVVAAPLIALSAPLVAFVWALPPEPRRRTLDAMRRPPVRMAWTAISAPLSVFLLHGIALWLWHLPALYDAALADDGVHLVQHLCFFLTAALFWWGIAHGRYGRLGYGARSRLRLRARPFTAACSVRCLTFSTTCGTRRMRSRIRAASCRSKINSSLAC
jgi:cytochrome c oxidase assembly factor CtaG